jgi:hypothetical protein
MNETYGGLGSTTRASSLVTLDVSVGRVLKSAGHADCRGECICLNGHDVTPESRSARGGRHKDGYNKILIIA